MIETSRAKNLLDYRPVRLLYSWAGFPILVQAVFLLFFAGLTWLGWGVTAPAEVSDKAFAKSHLATLVIWGLWWPGMVWLVVFFGRVWCAVCPLELVANGTERLGRSLGVPQRALGRAIGSGLLILFLYAMIQLLVAGVHLHRVPAYTSIFLLAMLTLAAATGFLFRDRAFCRGFCPVGLLLSVYGRGTMLAVRAVSRPVCESCGHHSCRHPANRQRLDGRSCPSLLDPARLHSNRDCLLCGQCIKSCRPEGNMGLFLRLLFSRSDRRESLTSWVTTLFIMLLSGFVGYELCTEWPGAKDLFLAAPAAVTRALGSPGINGWLKGVWTLMVFPLILWTVLGMVVIAGRGARTLGESWRRLALPMAVLVACGHMAKGLAKAVSWGGYLPAALANPSGGGGVTAAPKLLEMPVVSGIGIVLTGMMIFFAVRETRFTGSERSRGLWPPLLAVGLVEIFLIGGWALG